MLCNIATQVVVELPRQQTLDWDNFIQPWPPGPASVQGRSAPRRSSSRRAPWRARSYAGAAQYPCAEHTGGSPPVAPSTTPLHPGPVAQDSPAWPMDRQQNGWGDPSLLGPSGRRARPRQATGWAARPPPHDPTRAAGAEVSRSRDPITSRQP